MKKECKKHGIVEFRNQSKTGNHWRCTKCSSEAVQKRRETIKEWAVEYKGGRCCLCGYDKCIKALEFHHTDRSDKEFGISSKGYTRSWEKVKSELDKCILVCANCHREIEAGLHDLKELEGQGSNLRTICMDYTKLTASPLTN